MSAEELAQKILDWIKRTRELQEKELSETRAVDRMDVLVDDIEELCKKQLAKEQ